ncbi:helix-turn-helix domain-containing protein [Hymenobacter bucti]|uniref:Helix-turn-helix domain-containing protein n=1 Tax=Hymenobacter bucti TaxID=1844114 RepID=A0ABW4R1U9_9BACT
MLIPQQYLSRQAEISASFVHVMNQQMDDFMAGRLEEMGHIKDIASVMCLHPTHVSAIVKAHTGRHPCYFFEQRILQEAKALLANPAATVSSVAARLTYDASNFTKFFKLYEGVTPTEYRRQLFNAAS